MEELTSLKALIQYGFAGFSVILVMVIVWLVNKVITVLERTHEVITRNTQAINDLGVAIAYLDEKSRDTLKLLRRLERMLLARGGGPEPAEED